MLDVFKKRYWIFYAPMHEADTGMGDLKASLDDLEAAKKLASKASEWSAVFDSHTGKQFEFRDGELLSGEEDWVAVPPGL